ncbi:hypothetical protein KBD11_02475, partial [Candidatus Saccharibacteria bacterium]|nr:hypothetical protein [Candidatus Saccharibacteria bacterium]
CKGYGASYASTPPIVRAATPPDARLSKRATVYARNKVHSSIHSLGYAVMRRFIAPTQAYGSPALGGGAAGALIVPSEAIDDRNAGIVLALSAISALSVYRRSHRENLQ